MRHSVELSVVGCPAARAAARLPASPPSPPRSPRAAPVNIDCSICELIGEHEKGGDVGAALLDDTVQESDDHDLTRLSGIRYGAAHPANLRYRYGTRIKRSPT